MGRSLLVAFWKSTPFTQIVRSRIQPFYHLDRADEQSADLAPEIPAKHEEARDQHEVTWRLKLPDVRPETGPELGS